LGDIPDDVLDNLSAVDCLRRGLENLRDLLNAVNDKYGHSLK